MRQNLNDVNKWPFPKTDYIRRFFWLLIRKTLWPLFWHRLPFLRMGLLKLFGASTDFKSLVFGSVTITRPWDLKLGNLVAIGSNVTIYNLAKVEIGDRTVISQDVYLCGGTHDYSISNLPLLRKDIVIGDDVWICAGAFIAPGIKIGNGAIVGARSVVVKDVEPWTVVAGNPAKFIKKREIKG